MNSRTLELNPDKNLDTNDTLLYNYYKTSIHEISYEKTQRSGGYIKIPVSYDLKMPNLISSVLESPYICTGIYITKKLHSITNLKFDGELVLEHSPVTNGFKKIYVCIPLKTDRTLIDQTNPSKNNSIDQIIENAMKLDKKTEPYAPVSFVLNNFLENGQRVIMYDSPGYLLNQTVILFTKPVLVSSDFTDFNTDPNLFHLVTEKYKVLVSQMKNGDLNKNKYLDVSESLDEGFSNIFGGKIIEGLTKTAYCQPIDNIDPSVSATANLEIPLSGQYSPNDATNNMVRIILNFVSFLTLLVATFFGVPFLYELFIIKLILSNDGFTSQDKLNRLGSVDIYTSCVVVSFIFVLITGGISSNNTPKVIMGFFMFMFFVVAFLRIQFLKQDTDTFLKPFGGNAFFSNVKFDIGSFVIDNLKYLMEGFMASAITFVMIFLLLMTLAYTMNLGKVALPGKNAGSTQDQTTIAMYVFLLSLYLTILIKYFIGTSKSAPISDPPKTE